MEKLVLDTKTKYIFNDNIKTIDITLIFPTKYEKKDMHSLKILKMFLSSYSKKYPTEKEYKNALSRHFIINLGMSTKVIGKNLFIRFDLTIPQDKIIDGYDIEDPIKFFKETIYNPISKDNHLDEDKFNREKEFIKTRLDDTNRSIYDVSFNRLMEIIDEDEELFTHPKSSKKYLELTTSTSAYELYKKAVLNSHFISYVYGNFEIDKISKLMDKYFKEDANKIEMDKEYNLTIKTKEYAYYEETSKFNQTALYMVYSVKNMSVKDREYFSLIANILGNRDTDLIFNNLRLKNNLVYSSSVSKYVYSGVMIVETYLQYKNAKKAQELVKETLASLKDELVLQEYINRLLKGIEIDLLKSSDSKYFKLENTIDEDLDYRPLKEIYDAYKKMNIKDVINFLDKIELNTIFVLRGENDEEE